MIRLSICSVVVCLLSAAVDHGADLQLPIVKLGEQRLAVPSDSSPTTRIDRPYFDTSGRLLWNGSLTISGSPCPDKSKEYLRATWLLSPRVDEVRCQTGVPGIAGATTASLVGLDPAGIVSWQRSLGFASGTFTIDQGVIGASAGGLVLSDLTLISPKDGTILLPPRTHPVGSERRPVPDFSFTPVALYLEDQSKFLLFSADVTLVRRIGGLFLLDAKTGTREQVLPLSTTLLGGYWRIEDMALSDDHRYVFLAQKLAIRGGGGVSFALLDLAHRQLVFEEHFGKSNFCREPRLALGHDGNVGFSYLDQTAGQRVLVHYRMKTRR
ncbi:MAG TPA: hypothetical protein VFE33_25525 [Thermoanaerobaculia bacterium]|nr:hypothetical protein [Thermoanaerobaculia bacterium]